MDIETKVKNLDAVTTDLARLFSQSRLKLGENEQRMINMSAKIDDGHKNIIAALATLQESQNVHMARSDEKFSGQGKTLDRFIDKLDETIVTLASNNQLTETLQNHTATLFKRADQTEIDVALCQRGSKGATPTSASVSVSLIDSPNFRWVMIPIIIILLGLFGLAGFNMTGDVKGVLGVASDE